MKRCNRRSDRGVRSPGRLREAMRENHRPFWTAIASGRSSEDAAVDAGVSPAVGVRWFRMAGGMAPTHLSQSSKLPSERYLSFAEREEIAILRAQGHGVRAIARQLDRPACTISRELRRNVARRHGAPEYRATTAQWHADRAARRPKPAKLAVNPVLQNYVQDRLAGMIAKPNGEFLVGPKVLWKGRRAVHRQPDAGRRRGARNRFLGAFGSTFPRTRRCASVMRRSIRRFMCKVVEPCAAN
jgi:hypothetical protein